MLLFIIFLINNEVLEEIIPDKTYTYVYPDNPKSLKNLLFRTVHNLLPHPVFVLSENSLPFYIGKPELPENYDKQNEELKLSILQSTTLYKYGGVWIDHGIFPFDSLYIEKLIDRAQINNLNVLWLFKKYEKEKDSIVSLIIAKKNSIFFQRNI